jgi:hypothetical protein
MKLPLKRKTVEALFDIDTENNSLEVCMNYDVEELENAYIKLQQEFNQYKKESAQWSIEDFAEMACQKEGVYYNGEDPSTLKGKLKIYDPDKFQAALENMIAHHDAEIGITWDTIDAYLDNDCRL